MTRKQHLARIAQASDNLYLDEEDRYSIRESIRELKRYRCLGYIVKWWQHGTAYKSTLGNRQGAYVLVRYRKHIGCTDVKVFSVWVKVK